MKEYNDDNVGQNGYKEDEDWSFIGFEELAKESREALKKDNGYKYSSNPVIEDYYKSIEEENKQAYKDYIDRHHRPLIPAEDGRNERKEMVSKALAAQLLLDSPVTYEYSPRLITFVAQRVDKAQVRIRTAGRKQCPTPPKHLSRGCREASVSMLRRTFPASGRSGPRSS